MIVKPLNVILRDLREDHDIKQETIARYLGISQQAYSNYENGHREIPVTAVSDYADENVSTKVVKIIQSYVEIVNKMVWRK